MVQNPDAQHILPDLWNTVLDQYWRVTNEVIPKFKLAFSGNRNFFFFLLVCTDFFFLLLVARANRFSVILCVILFCYLILFTRNHWANNVLAVKYTSDSRNFNLKLTWMDIFGGVFLSFHSGDSALDFLIVFLSS